ncbi:beta-lactamase [Aureococcus anophagefferens]|nr:beta-lactamase [Aureococcus anophagefferens]
MLRVVAGLLLLGRAAGGDVAVALGEAPGTRGQYFQNELQGVVDFLADYYNTSFSLTFHGPRAVYTAVAGVEDRVSGRLLAREDLIPLGSATKPFTAAGVLRLAERSALEQDLPGEEYVPTAVVGDAPHDLHCAPGACGVYSSVGYPPGLAAATAVNLSDWRALDQGALAFGGEPGPGLVFPVRGACADVPGVVHQYATRVGNGTYGWFDVIGDSCLNAWTAGNVAATTQDLARFWHRLFDGTLLSASSLAAMTSFEPLTWGWFPGLEYGAGLMAQAWAAANGTYSLPVLGHGGEDYGSETALNGYVAALNAPRTRVADAAPGRCLGTLGS